MGGFFMQSLRSVLTIGVACLGSILCAQQPCPAPSSEPAPEPLTLQDIDYQIELCKQYIEKYKNQAYIFDDKAQTLLSHDFTDYREAEAMSERCQAIADDLSRHLQELEKQREQMLERQPKEQPKPQK